MTFGLRKVRTLLLAAALVAGAAAANAAQTSRVHFFGHGVVTFANDGDFVGIPVSAPVKVGDRVIVGGDIWYPGDLTGQTGTFPLEERDLLPQPGGPPEAFVFNVVGGAVAANTAQFFVYAGDSFTLDHGQLVGLYLYTDGDTTIMTLRTDRFSADFQRAGFNPPSWGGTWSLDGGGVAPEPGVWAMLLLGFGALGSALRRSRATGRPVVG